MRYLELDDVFFLAARLGEPPPRDIGLVRSAVARPRTTVFGDDAYPDIHTKAAAVATGTPDVSAIAAALATWVRPRA